MEHWRRFGCVGVVAAVSFAACRGFEVDDSKSSPHAGTGGDGSSGATTSSAGTDAIGGGVGGQHGGATGSGSAGEADAGSPPQMMNTAGAGGAAGASIDATGGGGAGGLDGGGGAGAEPGLLGAEAPGIRLNPSESETYALGYYTEYMGAGWLGPEQPGIMYGNTFGPPGSRPYVLGAPAACGTHGELTEFAGFGVVYGNTWHNSLHDFYWTWGLDEKYDGTEGAAPWPAVWNGVLVAFELVTVGDTVRAKFTVDWDQRWWQDKAGVKVLDFTPEGLSADLPAYPVIGRWQHDRGERLGLYQNGAFYLDWDGDNAWDAQNDRVLHFAAPGEYPVAADFWPGGGDEVGLYKDGNWYIDANQNGTWDGVNGGDLSYQWGDAGSLPVVARNGWTRNCPP